MAIASTQLIEEEKCPVTAIAIPCTLTIIAINLTFAFTYWFSGLDGVQRLLQTPVAYKACAVALMILTTSIYSARRYYKAKSGLTTVRMFNMNKEHTKLDLRFHLDASITRLKDINNYADKIPMAMRNDYDRLFKDQH